MPVRHRRHAPGSDGDGNRKRRIGSPSSDPYELSSDPASGEDELASDSGYSDARQPTRNDKGKGKGKAAPIRGYISDTVLENHRSVSQSHPRFGRSRIRADG